MTSKKTKEDRMRENRLKRAKALSGIDTRDPHVEIPHGAVLAESTELAHNNTYGRLPRFYVDRVIVCRQCHIEEVWPAERQKWWYEAAKGNINSDAVLCRSCRDLEKARKDEAKRVHLKGLAEKSRKDHK